MDYLKAYYRLLERLKTAKLILGSSGQQYGITKLDKLKAIQRIKTAKKKKPCFTSLGQHMVMVDEILNLPASVKGDVVECGCFNGGSTIPLSIACALTGRKLYVCDCFDGLPEFTDSDNQTIYDGKGKPFEWRPGEYSSSLYATKRNIELYGEIDVCHFIKGYFSETLESLPTNKIAMIFEDADLPSSVKDCIKYLWLKLQDGCKFFSHEPGVVGVVSLFYDRDWWKSNFDLRPPGMFGSGHGHTNFSGISYSIKHKEDGHG